MNMHSTWRRPAANLLAVFGVVLLLAACTLSSKEKLVTDDEATTPLPQSFAFFSYTEKPEGFVRTDEAGQTFTLDGKGYVNPDGTMTAYFVPLAGNTYLLAASGADSSLYGVARLFDTGIMQIDMVFGAGLEQAIAAAAAPTAITSALTVSDGGIEVTSREALDFVIGLIVGGKLPTAPLIAYVGETAESPTPTAITKDGESWKVVN